MITNMSEENIKSTTAVTTIPIPIATACKENGFIDDILHKKILDVYSTFDLAYEKDLLINKCFLSFNGGKDCTILLYLLKTYFEMKKCDNDDDDLKLNNIRIIYIQPDRPFKEVEQFVDKCEKIYNIKIERHRGKLRTILDEICKKNNNLEAVIMGSRRSDPHCENLETFHPTDSGWPKLMRINPLLDWTNTDVWNYIRSNQIEYCSLYDEGYTSLGDTTNTQKNPHLKYVVDENGEVKYRPAYELHDDKLERAGRT